MPGRRQMICVEISLALNEILADMYLAEYT